MTIQGILTVLARERRLSDEKAGSRQRMIFAYEFYFSTDFLGKFFTQSFLL